MKGYYNDVESTENVLKDGMYHTGDYGRINNAGRLVLLQRNPDIILLPTGEKISRVRTNEQITAINGVAEGFIIFYNNRLTAVIVPIDKSATDDISINPMNYVNNKIVAYKNPHKPVNDPYNLSAYSGMMFNGYI